MKAKLHLDDKKAISSLSKSAIEVTTAGLKPYLKRSIWIGKSNHYAHDVVRKLKKQPANATQRRQLAQYISASICLHANDGWSYLGRSISCLLAGDMHRALHLAYYAELRAAMSLLASTGIGIFNTKHFVISAANSTTKLKSGAGTHVAAWIALEQWCRLRASGAMFATIIRPEGRTLEEWFQPHGGAAALAPQARNWFMQWGMDLGFASKDRDARNESSYRPDGVPTLWGISPAENLRFVREMWATLEPSSASGFEQIDRYILRIALERLYLGRHGRVASPADPTFVGFINATLLNQGFSSSAEDRLRRFLLRQASPNDPEFFAYSAAKPANADADAFAVLSRALLLLRTATGSAQMLVQKVGVDSDMLSFWWTQLGEARGLWQTGSPPDSLSDLWADVQQSLDELDNIETHDPGAFQSANSVAFGMQGLLNVFTSHERVGLWGLFPA
ncbi:hypothetical protein CN200_19455 [Sinorhizobium meliloti]|uniref:hypothetical protein n=1 Tax=Rhizobium meliloti TaxID=382 RepID=UPI000FD51857|nr:hypothetical protein [Sinorhizobium meliloti]RVI14596.1 hypothetical protein CN200_19455 [Sinorhizobium meliloti]RVN92957.1 hypothetical protein CN107_05415 [Sinorhizobium meliloti]RVO03046.1 hypothetical protein CN103_25410 [Sinorhizobium meliloti]